MRGVERSKEERAGLEAIKLLSHQILKAFLTLWNLDRFVESDSDAVVRTPCFFILTFLR